MKARVPVKISSKDKRALEEFAKVKVKEEQGSYSRRFYKLICYVLNRDFGFGKKRLFTMIAGVNKLLQDIEEDPIFWEHLDHVVIDELKLEFDREKIGIDGRPEN